MRCTGTAGFDYTLTAANEGRADAASVRVSFTLPAGLTFASASGAGFAASESAGVVHLDGALAADSSATLTVRVTAASDGTYTAPVGAATIGPVPLNILVDSDLTNNSSSGAVVTGVLTRAIWRPPTWRMVLSRRETAPVTLSPLPTLERAAPRAW